MSAIAIEWAPWVQLGAFIAAAMCGYVFGYDRAERDVLAACNAALKDANLVAGVTPP